MSAEQPQPPPPWAWWYESARHHDRSDLRIGDAERSAMADLLSKHYADGRLDDEEFKSRLEAAMSAKTRNDLVGLTYDLPRLGEPDPPPVPLRRRRVRQLAGVVLVAAVLAWLAATATAGVTWHLPWLLIAVVCFLLWRRASWHRWHHHHEHHSQAGTSPFA